MIAPSGDHFDDDNIFVENLEDPAAGQERQAQDDNPEVIFLIERELIFD